jgi:hypothetical protein
MSELARHKILAGNALDFFNLPKTRPADRLDRKEQNQ